MDQMPPPLQLSALNATPSLLPLLRTSPPCRLLQQGDPALRQLPQHCLQRLLAFARRPDQGRGDIVRRSGARWTGF